VPPAASVFLRLIVTDALASPDDGGAALEARKAALTNSLQASTSKAAPEIVLRGGDWGDG
jgi:hypothetical protein